MIINFLHFPQNFDASQSTNLLPFSQMKLNKSEIEMVERKESAYNQN